MYLCMLACMRVCVYVHMCVDGWMDGWNYKIFKCDFGLVTIKRAFYFNKIAGTKLN